MFGSVIWDRVSSRRRDIAFSFWFISVNTDDGGRGEEEDEEEEEEIGLDNNFCTGGIISVSSINAELKDAEERQSLRACNPA